MKTKITLKDNRIIITGMELNTVCYAIGKTFRNENKDVFIIVKGDIEKLHVDDIKSVESI